jgi:thiamine biosynthesis protein ThiS
LRVKINGEEREVAEGTTLETLVGLLGLEPERLAVERNRQVVRRAEWSLTVLEEADSIEVVHFVGGGSEEWSRRPAR